MPSSELFIVLVNLQNKKKTKKLMIFLEVKEVPPYFSYFKACPDCEIHQFLLVGLIEDTPDYNLKNKPIEKLVRVNNWKYLVVDLLLVYLFTKIPKNFCLLSLKLLIES